MENRSELTEKPVLKALMGLAFPIMASSFFQSAYNLTDMAWMGRLGAASLAGVGSAGMFLWFSRGVCMLARMGGQVWTAQMIGKGDRERAALFAGGAVRLGLVLAFLYQLACIFLTAPMLSLFNIRDEDTVRAAVLYLRITGGTVIFPFLNMVITGLFTAQGDSRTPFFANAFGIAVNMILDPLLIFGVGFFPRMGVAGGALATAVSQAAGTAIFLAAQCRDRGKLPLFHGRRVQPGIYREIVRVGMPSALQSVLYTCFSMGLTRICSGFGSVAIAVQQLGGHIETVTWNAAEGFGSAMNAFTAQNYGAGKFRRIREGYRLSFMAVAGWGLLFTAVFLLFPGPIARIFFVEGEPGKLFMKYLTIVGLGEAFMCVELMANGAISGFGETRICGLASIILTGSRIPLALLLTRAAGLNGVWWTLLATTTTKGIVLDRAFAWVFRRKYELAMNKEVHESALL